MSAGLPAFTFLLLSLLGVTTGGDPPKPEEDPCSNYWYDPRDCEEDTTYYIYYAKEMYLPLNKCEGRKMCKGFDAPNVYKTKKECEDACVKKEEGKEKEESKEKDGNKEKGGKKKGKKGGKKGKKEGKKGKDGKKGKEGKKGKKGGKKGKGAKGGKKKTEEK